MREAWESELDRLREEYGRALPARLAGLETLLRAALRSRERESLEAARREAHSLKGSSGSYGFDVACRELQAIEDAGGPDVWPALEQALARARDSLRAA